jgi:hypothetical protein
LRAKRRSVHADVPYRLDRSKQSEPAHAGGMLGVPIKRIDTRQRRAGYRDRHGMLTGVARLEMHRIMIHMLVVMQCGLRMLVRGRTVPVLGVTV